MAEARILAVAEQEYAEAISWYAGRSAQAAERFRAEFKRAIQMIEQYPQVCARCDRQHRYYLMRRYPYQVIFREQPQGALIVAVAHCKRRPGYWHGR
jgi:plasmid stabilization system protein ParE